MRKKNKKYTLIILLLLLVCVSIGYAALTTTLNINGNTNIEKASWDIHFENLQVTDGSVSASVDASIDSTKTFIDYTILLQEPGDFYEFTVDMVNSGTIDAMISEVLKQGVSSDQEKYIEYSATYSDGIELEEKDYLKSGERQNIKVRVKYREDINTSDLPTEENVLTLKFSITYIQADETAKDKSSLALCKRAEVLHTEECTQTDTTKYCSGAGYTTSGSKGTTTITYGNLGKDGVLNHGDAFDCDVNGDGTYDSETERFYYVSDVYNTSTKQFDSNYATLIYYSNTKDGVANDTSGASINYSLDGFSYAYSPDNAIDYLPTINQWKNVSLISNERALLTEEGNSYSLEGNLPTNFSYTKYENKMFIPLASRLLTFQELSNACYVAEIPSSYNRVVGSPYLDNCNYLFEGSIYSNSSMLSGFWLENPVQEIDENGEALYIASSGRYVYKANLVYESTGIGVRPVIEVAKSDIDY